MLETGTSLSSALSSGSIQCPGEIHQEGLKCCPRVESCSAGWEAPKVLRKSLTYLPKLCKRPPRCCPTGTLGLFSGVALAAAHPPARTQLSSAAGCYHSVLREWTVSSLQGRSFSRILQI